MHTHFNLRTRVPRDGEVPYIRYARKRAFHSLLAWIAGAFCASPAFGVESAGWAFGDGFTSNTPGAPAEIYYRAFSIGNMPEFCRTSPIPVRFVVRDPVTLRVGQVVQRIGQVPGNKQDSVIVDAYDARGEFVPHVPVRITVIDTRGIVGARTDGDYLEGLAIGEAAFEVTWACGSNDAPGVQARIRIVVRK